MTFLGSMAAGFWAIVLFMNFLESHDGWALFGFLDALFILRVCGMSEEQVATAIESNNMIEGMMWTGVATACLAISAWFIVLALVGPFFAPTLAERIKKKYWPEFENDEKASSPGIIVRR